MDVDMVRCNNASDNGKNFYYSSSRQQHENEQPRQRKSQFTSNAGPREDTISHLNVPPCQGPMVKNKHLPLICNRKKGICLFVGLLVVLLASGLGFVYHAVSVDAYIVREVAEGQQSVTNDVGIIARKVEAPSGKRKKSTRTPIIIIPGSLGSILEAKLDKTHSEGGMLCSKVSDWYTLWISEGAILAQKCFFDNIKMKYNKISTGGNGQTSPKDEGVEVRVPFYGSSVKGVRCMLPQSEKKCDATKNWKTIIEKLEALGYIVGIDLFSAPYDFRQGPDDFLVDAYPKLKMLVEYVHKQTNRKVKLASISMGGPFIHTFFTHFVDQEWKDTYIDSWLSLAGIFNGFTQSFQNVVFGRNQFLGFPLFGQTDVRDAYRSWFSANWLIPKPIYGDDRVILVTPSHQYRLSDIPDLLYGDQREMYLRSFRYNSTADPGVPVSCWFSRRFKTVTSLEIPLEMNETTFYCPLDLPVDVKAVRGGNGDDAVDIDSLSICKGWKSTFEVRETAKCHGCLLNSEKVADYLSSSPADKVTNFKT